MKRLTLSSQLIYLLLSCIIRSGRSIGYSATGPLRGQRHLQDVAMMTYVIGNCDQ